jgi:gamma-glutamyl phosphate reductase
MTIREQVSGAKKASIELAALSTDVKDKALDAMAAALDKFRKEILQANAEDLKNADAMFRNGDITQVLIDRLKVTDVKITGMIAGIRDVIKLKDPVGQTLAALELDDDLELYQVSCPIGVLGVIFESRPDVVPQIMSLCLKSGNAVIFKGGKEASASNRSLFSILRDAAASAGVPKDVFVLMESRDDVNAILEMDEYIDLLIPRGSNEFVRFIQDNTRIPVLGHAAGICHVYVDKSADMKKALDVVLDSKIQYPAVCNAVETLIVHSEISKGFLPKMAELFIRNGVEIRADERSAKIIGKDAKKAEDSDWDEEYNDLIISVKTVDSVNEAVLFINEHGSGHTDTIISEDRDATLRFVSMVDSAGVLVNASTRFDDGYRFGKGAEVGISTNKIHARGPVGMEGLMIYKYILIGNGHVVKDYSGSDPKKYKHKVMKKSFKL